MLFSGIWVLLWNRFGYAYQPAVGGEGSAGLGDRLSDRQDLGITTLTDLNQSACMAPFECASSWNSRREMIADGGSWIRGSKGEQNHDLCP
jgi:hypothetical protein